MARAMPARAPGLPDRSRLSPFAAAYEFRVPFCSLGGDGVHSKGGPTGEIGRPGSGGMHTDVLYLDGDGSWRYDAPGTRSPSSSLRLLRRVSEEARPPRLSICSLGAKTAPMDGVEKRNRFDVQPPLPKELPAQNADARALLWIPIHATETNPPSPPSSVSWPLCTPRLERPEAKQSCFLDPCR